MRRNYLTLKDVASRSGYTIRTLYEYHHRGILPPPRERFGSVMLFAREDVSFWLRTHKRRPSVMKSRRRSR